mmetsp:Transcript_11123/g.25322  ORF Transcript_11123/g.25322 Transcript_11123/m.25322 type:complete len:559 (+) Transcript_11123:87-1763(+)
MRLYMPKDDSRSLLPLRQTEMLGPLLELAAQVPLPPQLQRELELRAVRTNLEAAAELGVHPVRDCLPLLGLCELQHLRHVGNDAGTPAHHHEVRHELEVIKVQRGAPVLRVAIQEAAEEAVAVLNEDFHLGAGYTALDRPDEGSASQHAPVEQADLHVIVFLAPEEGIVDLQVVVGEADKVVGTWRSGAAAEAVNLKLVVHVVHDAVLPLLEPGFVGDIAGEDPLCCIGQKPDELLSLPQVHLARSRVSTWNAVGHALARARHGEHLVHPRVQLLLLVQASHLAKSFAAGHVVHGSAIGQFPVHVLVIGRLNLSSFELLLAFGRPLDTLGDQHKVCRRGGDVPVVELRNPERSCLLKPVVEDDLRPVVVPHARHIVPIGASWLVWKLRKELLMQVGLVPLVLHIDDALEAGPAADKLPRVGDLCHGVALGQHSGHAERLCQPHSAVLHDLVLAVREGDAVVVPRLVLGREVPDLHVLYLRGLDVLPGRGRALGLLVLGSSFVLRVGVILLVILVVELDSQILPGEPDADPSPLRTCAGDPLELQALADKADLLHQGSG